MSRLAKAGLPVDDRRANVLWLDDALGAIDPREVNSFPVIVRDLTPVQVLDTMLTEVVDAAREVLDADRGTVFLYDENSNELVVRVATKLGGIRIPADKGIVGESATTRKLINVPDCYADERFNRAIDKETGYRSRCMLTIPLIGFEDTLIGVLQILNKNKGVFDDEDEFIATALAAQAAVVIHRAKLIESMIATERLDREIEQLELKLEELETEEAAAPPLVAPEPVPAEIAEEPVATEMPEVLLTEADKATCLVKIGDTMPGELANIIAGRVAAVFNFHGPNFTADAACASAMAAFSAAIAGLEEGDYDGLTAMLLLRSDEGEAGFEGVIFPFEPPEVRKIENMDRYREADLWNRVEDDPVLNATVTSTWQAIIEPGGAPGRDAGEPCRAGKPGHSSRGGQ